MLESVSLDPFVAGVVAMAGVALGLLLGRFMLPGPREVKRLRAEIERLGREHGEYQSRVTGHFEKTGELIGQMTASYKAVYDHLADGAQTLCAAEALPKPLFSAPRLIIDESLSVGQPAPRAASQAETVRLEPTPPAPAAVDGDVRTLEATESAAAMPASSGRDDVNAADAKIESPR
jgi:uncharacterized membrane-anchored protein YhcB (DUF1043 family)